MTLIPPDLYTYPTLPLDERDKRCRYVAPASITRFLTTPLTNGNKTNDQHTLSTPLIVTPLSTTFITHNIPYQYPP